MPPSTTWKYIRNQFATATEGSRKRMNTLLVDHLSKVNQGALTGAPAAPLTAVLQKIKARTEPVAAEFKDAYESWMLSRAQRRDATETYEYKFGPELQAKLQVWDITIQSNFRKRSPIYRTFFPHGHRAFTTGSFEQRMAVLAILRDVLGSYEHLSETRQAVADFYQSILELRKEQQQIDALVAIRATVLKARTEECAALLYGNLGLLMNALCQTPEAVANYFSLETLRQKLSDEESLGGLPLPPTTQSHTALMFAMRKHSAIPQMFSKAASY